MVAVDVGGDILTGGDRGDLRLGQDWQVRACVRACVRSRAGSTSDCAQVLHALQAACQASGATLLLVVVAPGADGESSAAQLVHALFTASLLSHCLIAESLPPC